MTVAAKQRTRSRQSTTADPVTDYGDFLRGKRIVARPAGFDVSDADIHPRLFPFQRAVVIHALRMGRHALFADTGLGKTAAQLEWARHVSIRTGRPVLILAPLAVGGQTVAEGRKMDLIVTPCRSQVDVKPGLNIANYEMLHHFRPDAFSGVVIDESSILKCYTGKIKQAILAAFAATPYRLACTATPAPNDYLELGNHAQFLGVMESNEMISRWFINDTMEAGNYRLKKHAERDFWEWVCSWATCFAKPSDIGYDDAGYVLPPMNIHEHVVDVDLTIDRADGYLFRTPEMSATNLHKEMRLTTDDRAAATARIVATDPVSPWIIWCNTNYEADAIRAVVPGVTEVRGSDSIAVKESRLADFSEGRARIMLSKSSITGFGLNWQHCCNMVFVGLSYSYESMYQSIRRSWRFGQRNPVDVHVVMAETEGPVLRTIRRKQADHEAMKAAMVGAMAEFGMVHGTARDLSGYEPAVPMTIPRWMKVQP